MGRWPLRLRALLLAGALGLVAAVVQFASGAGLPTVLHEGRPYVELFRIAERLQAKLEATSEGPQARLTTADHVVTVTRNWTRALVDGAPVPLDAPVRVKGSTWLVPETFLARVLPMITAGTERPAEGQRPTVTDKAATEKTPSEKSGARAVAPAPPIPKPSSPALEDLRFRSYPTFTRVVLELSAAAPHRTEAPAAREARLRLIGLRAEPQAVEVRDGLVAEVRLERAGADAILRIVFEGAVAELKASTLADPYRLVLDFNRPQDAKTRPGREAFTPLRTIVLDAGHGGQDTGAVGPAGLYEKDLVLDVTKRVAKMVEERLKVRVLLTRDADVFVTLRDRTSFANKEGADLFVSIHANAHQERASTGVETFFLSSEATDSAARQVAAQENQVVQLERPATRGRDDIVKTILWDLAQSEFQLESSRLAEIVQDSMTQSLKIPNRGVKQAGFYVLGGAAMPAVLLEIGFVTNPREERRLKDFRYRDEIARAIFAGLAEYKRDHDQRTRAAAR
jgi:N-acetylmuramoyl-L-alanine amidase